MSSRTTAPSSASGTFSPDHGLPSARDAPAHIPRTPAKQVIKAIFIMMTDKKERGVYTLVFWLSNGMSVFFHPAGTQYHTRDDLPISRKNGKKRGIRALHKNRQPCKKIPCRSPVSPGSVKQETEKGTRASAAEKRSGIRPSCPCSDPSRPGHTPWHS